MLTRRCIHLKMSRMLVPFVGLLLILTATTTHAAIVTKSTNSDSRAMGIAHACENWLIGYARNPSLEDTTLRPLFKLALKEIKKATLFQFAGGENVGQAIGKIRGAQILGISRNPSLKNELILRANACIGVVKGRKFKLEEVGQ